MESILFTCPVYGIHYSSLLTASVTKLSEFVMEGLWDRIHREIRVSTHPSERLVALVRPLP
jgi:hypothetical protein